MADILYLNGYGVFVWPCYALSILALGGLAIWSWRSYRDHARKAHLLESSSSADASAQEATPAVAASPPGEAGAWNDRMSPLRERAAVARAAHG